MALASGLDSGFGRSVAGVVTGFMLSVDDTDGIIGAG